MTISARTPRARRGLTAIALVALVGSGLATPLTAAAAAEVEVPTESLISTGTEWKYLDTNVDPAAGETNPHVWTTAGFDDSEWKKAPSAFGAKRDALASVGPYMPTTQVAHYIDGNSSLTVPTYFFRSTFELEAGVTEQVGSVSSTIIHDDAVRIYVNGTRVANYDDGRVSDTAGTNLQYAGESRGDPQSQTFTIDPELLQDGTNTVAVALYQDRESSSDIYFDMTELKLEGAGEVGEGGIIVAPPSRVILTPTENTATSQSFSWMAGDASHEVGQVEIGLAAGGDTRVTDASAAGYVNSNDKQHFSATVDGLVPATAYRYRVGLPESWSDWFEFTTADPSETDFQFVYYGDAQIGLDTTWPLVVEQAEAQAPRSIGSVHAGDLIDRANNDTQWQNWFKGMEKSATSTNVFAAPGNHEYSGDNLMVAWKAHFEYPLNQPGTESIGELAKLAQGDTDVARQYAAYFEHWANFAAETVYYADYQNVRFITLNATRDSTFLKPTTLPACSGAECPSTKVADMWTQYQAAWLDYVLKNSDAKWNVVTFHQPVYSTSSGRNEPVLREHWVPVFEENNIDLVLMGHDHTYARGYNNNDTTDTTGLTTGPVYAVSNSGAKHYNLESEARNVWTNNGATQVIRGQYVTTYQVIDVSNDQLNYRSYVAEKTDRAASWVLDTEASGDRPAYASKAVPSVGEVLDQFTVTKYATGQKWITEADTETPAGPALSVSEASVKQGDSVELSGTGFTPGSEVRVELHSDPVVLGTANVQADGTFSRSVTIPTATATATAHSLVVVLPNGNTLSTPLTVLPAAAAGGSGGTGTEAGAGGSGAAASGPGAGGATDQLSNTGGADVTPFVAIGAVLLLAGAALFVARRRTRNAHSSQE